MSIKNFILSAVLLTALSGLAFSAKCPSVETVKTTNLSELFQNAQGYLMYSQIEFNGDPWYLADGVFQSEVEAREECTALLQRADEPEVMESRGATFCVYYSNKTTNQFVIATDVQPPSMEFLLLP